jgi:hypothetical protein
MLKGNEIHKRKHDTLECSNRASKEVKSGPLRFFTYKTIDKAEQSIFKNYNQ